MAIINRIGDFAAELTAWRQDLHAHPEIAFQEERTARLVAERLRAFGVDEVHTGIAKTGVIGVIRAGEGKGAIGLRADMDALPIQEATDLAHASKTPGQMHACGHDGHTTMLLGAARYLSETRHFDGTVYLIFQPAEEHDGGGRVMVEEGLFDHFPATQVFGMHNMPGLPAGSFAMRDGPIMAAADRLTIDVIGRGGHAATPHFCADPVIAAAHIVTSLQTVVARNADPVDQAVVSITQMHGGNAFNVIPDKVTLTGTARSFTQEMRDLLERRIGEISDLVGRAHGVKTVLRYAHGYPPTINTAEETELAFETAKEVVGEREVERNTAPVMGAEDFAYMLNQRPGSYIFIGLGEDRPMLHSSAYDFNDEVLPIGASYWSRLVERRMPAT